MNFKQKLFYAVAGFLVGNLILAAVAFGIFYLPKNSLWTPETTYAEAFRRMEAREFKEIKIKDDRIIFLDRNDRQYVIYPTEAEVNRIIRKVPNEDMRFSVEPYSVQQNEPNAPPLFYLFQILFWLFLISPPIIVILLLIIIKKMDSKDKLK
jgi:hypothetical protein